MKIVFVFIYGKNCKFYFHFKCLEDLSITVRHFVFYYEDCQFEIFHDRLHRTKNFIIHYEDRSFLFVVRIVKFFFRFKCLEDLSINVRILYCIMKIDSLEFFTIIYIELHNCLPLSTRTFTHINTIVYNFNTITMVKRSCT